MLDIETTKIDDGVIYKARIDLGNDIKHGASMVLPDVEMDAYQQFLLTSLLAIFALKHDPIKEGQAYHSMPVQTGDNPDWDSVINIWSKKLGVE